MKKYVFLMLLFSTLPLMSASKKESITPSPTAQIAEKPQPYAKAIFAGGCFWCMQSPFDKLKSEGVISTRVGYTGGTLASPTYEEVSAGNSGHRESVEITFDSKKITYKKLLDVFWHNIDPFNSYGQFCDNGEQYTSAVFYLNESQKKDYEEVLEKLKKEKKWTEKVTTVLLPAKDFYPAEDYHQSYYLKNPVKYHFYRENCGRDTRLNKIWHQ
jgi:peptide-methionine (S)-S-oxide reductase